MSIILSNNVFSRYFNKILHAMTPKSSKISPAPAGDTKTSMARPLPAFLKPKPLLSEAMFTDRNGIDNSAQTPNLTVPKPLVDTASPANIKQPIGRRHSTALAEETTPLAKALPRSLSASHANQAYKNANTLSQKTTKYCQYMNLAHDSSHNELDRIGQFNKAISLAEFDAKLGDQKAVTFLKDNLQQGLFDNQSGQYLVKPNPDRATAYKSWIAI
ncbi:MAG UNVERIFIED_CONTAM: hypothetical protein LVQ98_04200 [Rickettsiaceae bacterium]|jgi:hypothetical protein